MGWYIFFRRKNIFFNRIQKWLTSSFIEQISYQLFEEVFINGESSFGQNFFLNDVVYNYSIYPIILQNLQGNREHVLSLIYIYIYIYI